LATSLFERIPEAAAWFEKPDDLVPMTLAELQIEVDSIISRHEDLDEAANLLRSVRRRETLRIAIGSVLGDLSLDQMSQGISDLTECYLSGILQAVMESDSADLASRPLCEFLDLAIIAMGRFGGAELGFGSDADVIFVYKPQAGVEVSEAQRMSERAISEIRRLSRDSILEFELDLDLRPEGKNGAIARSIDSYEAYYERWSDTWEAQALLRARPIAGSKELQASFLSLINKYRYPRELKQSSVTEIRRIKARVETERLPQGADPRRHLKLGRGSLSDVEWLVQLIQLKHGAVHPDVRTPQTLSALRAASQAQLIAEHDARVLEEAWLMASRIRAASVLWANKRTDVLPADRVQLEGIARILEYPRGSATALEEDYLAKTRRARSVFERIFYQD
jgi:glutamate-ammonia-ligase adenylyltransferase